jgi:hypothetical protein
VSAESQLVADDLHVGLRGANGDDEPGGDLGIGEALSGLRSPSPSHPTSTSLLRYRIHGLGQPAAPGQPSPIHVHLSLGKGEGYYTHPQPYFPQEGLRSATRPDVVRPMLRPSVLATKML